MKTTTTTKTTTARQQRATATVAHEPFAAVTATAPKARKRKAITEESLTELLPTLEPTPEPPTATLGDLDTLVNLHTGEPVSEEEANAPEPEPTPAVVKQNYAITLLLDGQEPERLFTAAGKIAAYDAIVSHAKGLTERGFVAKGDKTTGYAVLHDNLVIGTLTIIDPETGKPALVETPRSRRSVLVAAKTSAMTMAFQNFLNSPTEAGEETLLGQMGIYLTAIRELEAETPHADA